MNNAQLPPPGSTKHETRSTLLRSYRATDEQAKQIRSTKQSLSNFKFRILNLFQISNFGFRAFSARSAFTLIELILYTGITAMVVVALTRAMLTILGTRERVESVSTVQQELRFAMDRVAYAARGAAAVETGASLFGVAEGRLSLVMGEEPSPTVFSLAEGRVIVREGDGEALPITSRKVIVEEFLVQPLTASGGTSILTVKVQGRNAAPELVENEADTMTLETAVTLRQ